MLFNCCVGEDCWESLALQTDQIIQSYRKSAQNIHWNNWCWNWSSNTLATWCKEPTHQKKSWYWEGLKEKEKPVIDSEMGRYHHWLNEHEFEQSPGNSRGQRSLACYSPGITKSWTWLSDWTATSTSHLILNYELICICQGSKFSDG